MDARNDRVRGFVGAVAAPQATDVGGSTTNMTTSTPVANIDPYAKVGIPESGLNNYWYPVLLAREVRAKPRAIKLLNQDLVVFRDGRKVYALNDRCAHRGARLSLGKCEFPGSGTITCAYHAWTYDGRTGECVAALLEGFDPSETCKAQINAYRAIEHAGLIWIFAGDMDTVPLEEDIPEFLADVNEWFSITVHYDYKCNWRALVDNFSFEFHAPYVHRNSPELYFQPMLPFAQEVMVEELPGKKGLSYRGAGGMTKAEFPGLGEFPTDGRRRFLKPSGRGKPFDPINSKAARKYGFKSIKQVRLPGYSLVGRASGEYWLLQWAVPVDNHTTRLFNINIWKRKNVLKEFYDRALYWTWRSWAHDWIFSGQDKRVLDDMPQGPERLSKTDVGLAHWRKFMALNARKPVSINKAAEG